MDEEEKIDNQNGANEEMTDEKKEEIEEKKKEEMKDKKKKEEMMDKKKEVDKKIVDKGKKLDKKDDGKKKERKVVTFADGINPGEGTSDANQILYNQRLKHLRRQIRKFKKLQKSRKLQKALCFEFNKIGLDSPDNESVVTARHNQLEKIVTKFFNNAKSEKKKTKKEKPKEGKKTKKISKKKTSSYAVEDPQSSTSVTSTTADEPQPSTSKQSGKKEYNMMEYRNNNYEDSDDSDGDVFTVVFKRKRGNNIPVVQEVSVEPANTKKVRTDGDGINNEENSSPPPTPSSSSAPGSPPLGPDNNDPNVEPPPQQPDVQQLQQILPMIPLPLINIPWDQLPQPNYFANFPGLLNVQHQLVQLPPLYDNYGGRLGFLGYHALYNPPRDFHMLTEPLRPTEALHYTVRDTFLLRSSNSQEIPGVPIIQRRRIRIPLRLLPRGCRHPFNQPPHPPHDHPPDDPSNHSL